MLVTPSYGMNYPNSNHIRAAILKSGLSTAEGIHPVVINCSLIRTIDFTAAKVRLFSIPKFMYMNENWNLCWFHKFSFLNIQGLTSIIQDFEQRGQPLIFLYLQDRIKRVITPLQDIVTTNNLKATEIYLSKNIYYSYSSLFIISFL